MQTQWSMRFEGEEVKVVALGTAWVAAVTSLNFLRIYTEGGLQVLLSYHVMIEFLQLACSINLIISFCFICVLGQAMIVS